MLFFSLHQRYLQVKKLRPILGKGVWRGQTLAKNFLQSLGYANYLGWTNSRQSQTNLGTDVYKFFAYCFCFSLSGERQTDLFARRFREGTSFPTLLERSILKLPLQRLSVVPHRSTEQSSSRVEKRSKRCEKRRRRGLVSKAGKKEKGRVKTG